MPYWIEEFRTGDNEGITSSQDSLIVSILSAGTFFGALTAAPVADLIGRRLGLMFSAGIVFNLGVVLQTISTDQPLLIAGRFFAGFGVGLLSAMVPLYQSETAPAWIRGTIVGAYQWAITIVSEMNTSLASSSVKLTRPPSGSLPRRHCKLLHQGSQRLGKLPHPHRGAVCMEHHRRHRNDFLARDTTFLNQTG